MTNFNRIWCKAKTVLGKSKNPEYDLKSIEELKHRTTKSPKFNLIKVRWTLATDPSKIEYSEIILDKQRKNRLNYNATHLRRISDILQIRATHSVT